MATHRIRKGLDLPILGDPEQSLHPAPEITRVALVGDDYPGLRARIHVEEGDEVRRGQLLFEDKTIPGVRHTSPGAGRVVAIHRGRRRALQAIVIQLSPAERGDDPDAVDHQPFETFRSGDPETLDAASILALLVESGLFTAFRARPFAKVPSPGATPAAIFVNAMDTHPGAPSLEVVLADRIADLQTGLRLLAKLAGDAPTYLCIKEGSTFAAALDAPVEVEEFSGPHPAGTPGLHIHTLAPASRKRSVWYLGAQEVAAVGALFRTGQLPVGRSIALSGPSMKQPRLVRTRLGASIEEHTFGEIKDGDIRLISGSVVSGKKANGPVFGFLGRYHQQVSALREGGERKFMGWISPGVDKFSVIPTFISSLLPKRLYDFDTDTNGSPRAIIPIGMYEKVMPMDILPTYLLRALVVGDVETAEQLGCLELDEEDIALCTLVCPGKIEYGPILRQNLDLIEKEL
ncbi:MAG: Na(+)-translocating NADH-quinone reductase subunit A [Myxococcota bacterium]